jgi:pimeloyl-ACP methyl ester carboxylesterase/DNA-binding CsgD family transcriptional regulator
MAALSQQIRFCTSFDGVRIAYALSGSGPSLVNAPHWLTHLEHDLVYAVRRPWFTELSRHWTLLRFDQRGCGLSDWDMPYISFDAWVEDLEHVVDAAGIERFALLGNSQGGAIAVEYAARHPDRVTHLVLWGAYARGRLRRDPTPREVEDAELQVKLIELGWATTESTYRDVFSSQFMPGGTLQPSHALSELERVSSSAANAARVVRAFYSIDVCHSAQRVRCPTLVLHARGDQRVPMTEGRFLATLIPGARFLSLDTVNHIMLEDEPAWRQYFAELRAFLPHGTARDRIAPAMAASAETMSREAERVAGVAEERDLAEERDYPAGLSPRELDVLRLVAAGKSNQEIAAILFRSVNTVANHVRNILAKTGAANRAEAAAFAVRQGLVER